MHSDAFNVYIKNDIDYEQFDDKTVAKKLDVQLVLRNPEPEKEDVGPKIPVLYQHVCNICNYGCSRPVRLRKHMESKHGAKL